MQGHLLMNDLPFLGLKKWEAFGELFNIRSYIKEISFNKPALGYLRYKMHPIAGYLVKFDDSRELWE